MKVEVKDGNLVITTGREGPGSSAGTVRKYRPEIGTHTAIHRDPWSVDYGGAFDGNQVTSDADPGL